MILKTLSKVLVLLIYFLTIESTFAQQRQNTDIKELSLSKFLTLLKDVNDPYTKDSILNEYFNSHQYLVDEKTQEKEKEIKIAELNNKLSLLEETKKSISKRLKLNRDSLNTISSNYVSQQYLTLGKSSLLISDLGFSETLGESCQISFLKNFSRNNLSYWGLTIGCQKNYEQNIPLIFGIKKISQIRNKNLFTSVSVWTSGFKANNLASHTDSKIGKVLRGNTFGGHFGLGKLILSQKAILLVGGSLQKYTLVKEGMSDSYDILFAPGAFASIGLVLNRSYKK